MNLTVGDLKKFLETHNPPDDAIVLVERVKDIYFENMVGKRLKKNLMFGKHMNI